MSGLPPYKAAIQADWIDYNGHLRDAHYTLIASYAADELMDYLGLDADYRARTRCTLYSLEMHVHYRREVKQSDELSVATSILDFDEKRIHVGCQFSVRRLAEHAATIEMMLLHVHQGDSPKSAAFPMHVLSKLAPLKLSSEAAQRFAPKSRAIELKRR
jgi:acyl-CoA thioester hydrolase